MSYTPTEWQPGDIVTSVKLNKIETELDTLDGDVDTLKSEINEVEGEINPKYTAYEQGAVAAATGQPTPNNNISRTGLIPIDEFFSFDSPAGWVTRVAYFSDVEGKTLLNVDNYSSNVAYTTTYRADILTSYPTCKSLRLHYQQYSGSTAQTTTPQMLAELAPVTVSPIGLIYPTKNTVDAIASQYFNLTDLTLTEDFTFTVPYGDQKVKNMLITHWAMWTGTDAPDIRVIKRWYNAAGTSLNAYGETGRYIIGEKGNYACRTFRVAPWFPKCDGVFTVVITVPEGTTLYIKGLSNAYDDSISRAATGFNINAHNGNGAGFPSNTLPAFEMAARLGYRTCITIPKVTSDGVYVCFHDDTGIQGQARKDDGSEIDAADKNRPISDFTYEELMAFDMGIARGRPFAGTRIALLEDYFKICARSGMHPMLSVHPNLSGHWADIKAMAAKYGVLGVLNIKSDKTSIETPMAVLLDDIESYTIDVSASESVVSRFDSLTTTYSLSKVRKVIEYNYNYITDVLIKDVLDNGYICGCFNFDTLDEMQELIEKGVTEFTDHICCSVGLNW